MSFVLRSFNYKQPIQTMRSKLLRTKYYLSLAAYLVSSLEYEIWKKNCFLTLNTNNSMEFQSLSYPQRHCTAMYGEAGPINILLFQWKVNEKK